MRRPVRGRGFRAEVVALASCLHLFATARVKVEAQLRDLGFEALEAAGDGLKGHADLAALLAEGFKLMPGLLGFGDEALGFAVQACEGFCCLRFFAVHVA